MRMEQSEDRSGTAKPHGGYSLNIDGREVPLNEEGYLADISDWSTEVAETMAEADGVELGDDHWLLIHFLHRFYKEFDIAPDMASLSRNLCKDQDDCRWTRKYILQLFPDGAKSACRYAGLPEPVGGCV